VRGDGEGRDSGEEDRVAVRRGLGDHVCADDAPAPARFSTTMVWPRYSPSFLCMTRATVSVPPPGAKPTTTVTGRFG